MKQHKFRDDRSPLRRISTLVGLLSLAFGFGVLIVTFVWLARLLAEGPKLRGNPPVSMSPA